MAIYVIGDLHLSTSSKKPMDIFQGWRNHTERLINNWQKNIKNEDTVVLAGDTSWGMSLDEAASDFALIHSLPGTKLILKGNHDYWWTSHTKMKNRFLQDGLDSLHILHNNSYEVEGVNLCGSRGWLFESGDTHDNKIINREAARIEASLKSVRDPLLEKIFFLHYPPVYADQVLRPFIDLMLAYGINRCYYGHIHGAGSRCAVTGEAYGIRFSMISSDYISFSPEMVHPHAQSG